MKIAYQILFCVVFVSLVVTVGVSAYFNDPTILKDIGLPSAAILFTIGSLWHKKEDQEMERQKYNNEINLALRDIRWGYYSKLKEVWEILRWKLEETDLDPEKSKIIDRRKGLGIDLNILEDEGEMWFDDKKSISKKIAKLRELKDKKEGLLIKILLDQKKGLPGSNNLSERLNLSKEIEENDREIDIVFESCKKEIFQHSKLSQI